MHNIKCSMCCIGPLSHYFVSCHFIVHIVDWFPTLLGLAGRKVGTETDGVDVWAALTTGQLNTRHTLGRSPHLPASPFHTSIAA